MSLCSCESVENMNWFFLRGKLGFDKMSAIIDIEDMVETCFPIHFIKASDG